MACHIIFANVNEIGFEHLSSHKEICSYLFPFCSAMRPRWYAVRFIPSPQWHINHLELCYSNCSPKTSAYLYTTCYQFCSKISGEIQCRWIETFYGNLILSKHPSVLGDSSSWMWYRSKLFTRIKSESEITVFVCLFFSLIFFSFLFFCFLPQDGVRSTDQVYLDVRTQHDSLLCFLYSLCLIVRSLFPKIRMVDSLMAITKVCPYITGPWRLLILLCV